MRWEGHVARVGDNRGSYRVLVERPRERDHLENLGVHGRIILKMDVQEVVWGGVDWIDLAYGRHTWRVHVIAELNHPVK
jgi:hypothetical protein